jgi:hypothetical protein
MGAIVYSPGKVKRSTQHLLRRSPFVELSPTEMEAFRGIKFLPPHEVFFSKRKSQKRQRW